MASGAEPTERDALRADDDADAAHASGGRRVTRPLRALAANLERANKASKKEKNMGDVVCGCLGPGEYPRRDGGMEGGRAQAVIRQPLSFLSPSPRHDPSVPDPLCRAISH